MSKHITLHYNCGPQYANAYYRRRILKVRGDVFSIIRCCYCIECVNFLFSEAIRTTARAGSKHFVVPYKFSLHLPSQMPASAGFAVDFLASAVMVPIRKCLLVQVAIAAAVVVPALGLNTQMPATAGSHHLLCNVTD